MSWPPGIRRASGLEPNRARWPFCLCSARLGSMRWLLFGANTPRNRGRLILGLGARTARLPTSNELRYDWLYTIVAGLRYDSIACRRSATRSSGCSIPHETRIVFSVMPAARRASTVIEA